jgi:FAD/FMN-containing dehydrogenase
MDHSTAVQEISAQVAGFYDRQQPFRIYHGSSHSTRPSNRSQSTTVSTEKLTHIIEIDSSRCTAIVEPNVPMDALVAATKEQGLVPLVVPEFPGITTGGAFSGTSGESTSFREGYFDHSINWVELVLGNGKVVKAYNDQVEGFDVEDKRADLFWGAASSFGTLGVVTLMEIRLTKAKPLVELKYYVTSGMKDAVRLFRQLGDDPQTEFLDGIVLSPNKFVVCAGRQVEDERKPPSVKLQQFTRRQDDWFYLHVDRVTSEVCDQNDFHKPHAVDYIPLTDYLFRYDRGGFWVARYAFKYFCVPFNFVTRWLLDRFMYTQVMYHALQVSGMGRHYIVQDVGVPMAAAAEFMDWVKDPENFGNYPIWLCPLRKGGVSALEEPSIDVLQKPQLLNFGIWGPAASKDQAEFIAQNKRIEKKVHGLKGERFYYAMAFLTEDEFWAIHNKPEYDALRAKYHAQHLPTLYDKVRVHPEELPGTHRGEFENGWKGVVKRALWDVWPFCGLYGVYKAWRGGDYMLQKTKEKRKTD